MGPKSDLHAMKWSFASGSYEEGAARSGCSSEPRRLSPVPPKPVPEHSPEGSGRAGGRWDEPREGGDSPQRPPWGRPRGGAAALKAGPGGGAGAEAVPPSEGRLGPGAESSSTMESGADGRLDAAAFLGAWRRFDTDALGYLRAATHDSVPGTRAVPLTINLFAFYLDNGYIEGKELDDFFHHLLEKLGPESTITEEEVQRMKEQFMSVYDVTTDGRLQIQELANMILPDDENFLLLFRRETPLDNSVEFMRIWRSYDADSSGFISAGELKDFLRDLFLQHNKMVTEVKLEEYTDTMMKIFDKNKDGRLDLNDLARILALQENFLLQFKMDACSQEERRRDFEKIFAHYDVSKTGALEGPEVDGFVKDMMELVKPSISGVDLDKFRQILLNHCDVNKDGKIQKSELALCLGLKINP
ncbi:PREDICTED: secretagogin [Sturnus vulgaris]|uniref:secretagogin n=1 Tax=Sturnus vulgaris TaxID=9172 RepID=UPI00071A5370|nr:PREDICTED: secretagogin [Sturnus vulgaris]